TQPEFIKAMQAMSAESEIFKRRFRIHSIMPLSKSQAKILDAADLLAWEVSHYIPSALGLRDKPMTLTLATYTKEGKLAAEYLEIDKLQTLADAMRRGLTPERVERIENIFGLRQRRRG